MPYRTFLALTLLTLGPPLLAARTGWLTDFAQARARAEAADRYLLIAFTGSDWCHYCRDLEREVFSRRSFRDYADQNLVLLSVDFPREHDLAPATRKQNEKLKTQLKVAGFPTVVLLSPQGEQAGRLGVRPGGAKRYVALLQAMIRAHQHQPAAAARAETVPNVPAHAVPWVTDLQYASKLARDRQRYLLIAFTASDADQRAEREMFRQQVFLSYAEDALVLLKADFPRRSIQPAALRDQNDALRQRYEVTRFPTILILAPDGRRAGRYGFLAGGPEPQVKLLQAIIAAHEERVANEAARR